ncbi:methenyltetrahydromethanopterin cyclohydrolase [Haloglomus litoreum]|uniref:methenyltetrahydromethanopterin cyclohydrolase n=1 Tax=Haloglomus litoreum TaxID=3034026 RepID=UPI0023E80B46|nr:methenyltetrahydromethanopterin cyclohydrolase [Haloglomus sp. DT116]
MESLNVMAVELVDEAIDFRDELAIDTHELDNGATVLDFGVEAYGGIEAGLLLAEIATGGLATVQADASGTVEGATVPHVELTCDHPALALLCSQKAGWDEFPDGYDGLGSGPARALVAEEEEFRQTGFQDAADFATLLVESDTLPDEAVAESVADLAGVEPGSVFLPTYRTGSIAGSVATAARAGELAVYRLSELDYDPLDVLTVTARAPVAPVAGDEATAMARTNDALAYGASVHLTVDRDFDRFDEVPSTAAEEYGTPFEQFFDDVDWNLGSIPREVFAPAQVTIDVLGGPTHAAGATDESLLAESFGLD